MNTSNQFNDAASGGLASDGAAQTQADQSHDASQHSEPAIEQSRSAPPLSAVFNVEVHHPSMAGSDGEDIGVRKSAETSVVSEHRERDGTRELSSRFDAAAQVPSSAPQRNETLSSRAATTEAEMEVLQDGRAKPALNDNLPPPKHAAKAVHAEIEA
jgi:hypothetical protein